MKTQGLAMYNTNEPDKKSPKHLEDVPKGERFPRPVSLILRASSGFGFRKFREFGV